MYFKNNIVLVQFQNRKTKQFTGTQYNYYSDVPLKVGQILTVTTDYGVSRVKVREINISEATLPGVLRARLKTLTTDNLLLDTNGNPEMDAQQSMEI